MLSGNNSLPELKHAYKQTLRLQSQILSLIYDAETFGSSTRQSHFSEEMSGGENDGSVVTLTIDEPLPSMKRLTEAIEEHWKAMIRASIGEAARQSRLPHFDKAMVEIEIVTPLKGIFFEDDNMEHMAFSVVGKWGEKGVTIIRISDLNELRQSRDSSLSSSLITNHEISKIS